MLTIKRFSFILITLTAVTALSACSTTVSQGVATDGSGANTLLWPSPADVSAGHPGGTWPLREAVAQIHAGMNKPQIRALIGAPHFLEGWVGVREWNYVFHFRDSQTSAERLCQYKILFDTDMIARSFYWQPADCAELIAPQPTAQAPQTVLTVSALFGFDEYGINDINAAGRAQLQAIVGTLKARVTAGERIVVAGYAGPIGSAAYNQTLSKKRAITVRRYLVSQGVPGYAITARGFGTTSANADCAGTTGAALKACNAPARRVVVALVPGPEPCRNALSWAHCGF